MRGEDVAARLNDRHIAGLRFVTQDFIPVSGLYAGQRCGGVAIRVTDKRAVRSMSMGIEIATVLKELHPEKFEAAKTLLLLGNSETVKQLEANTPAEQIVAGWKTDLATCEGMRKKYLLYQ
jgi:uncharacterized protein YbbC (DUF1343 family)